MTEYTNDHVEEIEEQLPEGIQIDGIGDIPEGGDDVKVPLMENGEPYPAHVAAEDTTPDSSLETYIDDPSEDEDEDEDKDADAEVDDSGYVRNPKSDYCESCSTTVGVLREAGVRFDRTTWVKISSGSLEFSINLAE